MTYRLGSQHTTFVVTQAIALPLMGKVRQNFDPSPPKTRSPAEKADAGKAQGGKKHFGRACGLASAALPFRLFA